MGAELFHRTDGQTDMTKLTVAFRNFSKARIAEGRMTFNDDVSNQQDATNSVY